jgi:hypothetical protein
MRRTSEKWVVDRYWTTFALALLAASASAALANSADAGQRNTWALLIGVGEYHDQENWQNLPFTENDVNDLKDVLRRRGIYEPYQVETLYNQDKAELWKNIQSFFEHPIAENDLVLVYFTGHGWEEPAPSVPESDEKSQTPGGAATQPRLYLVPPDFDYRDPSGSGIAVDDLRHLLDSCQAQSKVIIVDSCFAGTQLQQRREDAVSAAAASTISDAFAADIAANNSRTAERQQAPDSNGNKGIFAIASAREGQNSYGMEDLTTGQSGGRGHSIFSYWLIQALKGHADADLNGEVDIDEVFRFVEPRVRATAGEERQTPVRNYGNSRYVSGIPVLTTLRPQEDTVVYAELAEQIAWAVESRGLGQVVMCPNFIEKRMGVAGLYPTPADDGGLGKVARNELYNRLDLRPGAYADKNFAQIAKAFESRASARNAKSRRSDAVDPSSVVFVQGEIVQQKGNIVKMRAEAYQIAESGAEVPVAVGVGHMSLANSATATERKCEYPLTGKSVQVQETDFEQKPDPLTGDDLTDVASAIERWDQEDRLQSHPLQDSSYPFRVGIVVQGERRERPLKFVGNNAYVELNPGEVYRIRVDYRGRDKVVLKLLIDGLSIFDQPAPEDLTRLSEEQLQNKLQSKSIRLDVVESLRPTSLYSASAWPLFGNQHRDYDGPNDYRGYYIGTTGAYCQFEVVPSEESLAARQGGSGIGVITAVFYEELTGAKLGPKPTVGTDQGKVVAGPKLRKVPTGDPGRELGFLSIRYVPRNEYQQIKSTRSSSP